MNKKVCVHLLPKKVIPTAKAEGWVVRTPSGTIVGPFKNMGSARSWAQEWGEGSLCVLPIVYAPIVQAHALKRLGKRDEWPMM